MSTIPGVLRVGRVMASAIGRCVHAEGTNRTAPPPPQAGGGGGSANAAGVGACTSYVEFAGVLDAVREACCDQADDDCSTGFPMVCDAGCSAVLLPATSACTTFLTHSTPEVAGIDGADVLAQLNKAGQRCGGGKGH